MLVVRYTHCAPHTSQGQQANNARLDAAKVGAQVHSQLTSSAYGMVHAQAQISAGADTRVSYSYGGDVSGAVAPVTAI